MESELALLVSEEYPLRKKDRYGNVSLKENTGDPIRLNRSFPGIIKRSTDILFSLVIILLVLSWLTPLLALLIKVDSRGPVFFLQKRNGKDRKPFTCIKFRSMIVNDERDHMPVAENDARITRVGKFLRDYCIDELPQFLNVLWGNMTIIGPRPHMIRENLIYERLINNYSFRYKVKPGITGLSQVKDHGVRSSLKKMQDRVYWDIVYIKNWSPLLDVKILYHTMINCFFNK